MNDLRKPGFLSRQAHVTSSQRALPHWDSFRVAAFITFRLSDSLPQTLLSSWSANRNVWLSAHQKPWTPSDFEEYDELFSRQIDKYLDAGHGAAIFKDPTCRAIVENAIRYYAETKFQLYSYVVMPNHVHLLIMPNDDETILSIVGAIKRYTAKKLSGRKCWGGDFWQRECWDTLIRDESHFARVLAYIKGNNPTIAYSAFDCEI